MKLVIMQFSPISRHFISLRSKYSLQHPVVVITLKIRNEKHTFPQATRSVIFSISLLVQCFQ
jgi:hypothetical protein